MTKNKRKLLVFLSVLICSICLVFGLAACNNDNGDNTGNGDSGGEHTHAFVGFWLFDGAEGHYRFATCHPEVKSELEPHVDENADFKCDVCDYVMHVHVDENEDNICDECQSEIHKHTFAEEWSFNEVKHWHNATCEHFIERSGYLDHSFVNGVCECGVKESEVKVYALYKKSLEYELYFPQWLEWLESEGITVEYTASGDGIYHYVDHSEVRFLGERTVKVKAQSGGEPLADVWFMVTLYTDNEYYQNNGTIALGIAKTDASGIAEIAFNPVGGYSSATVEYRIRLALSVDIALKLGVKENDVKPIPDRYTVSANAFEYVVYEVSENSSVEDIAATLNFDFSNGWGATEKFTLPYHRYYTNPLEIEKAELIDENKTYDFTASGNGLFDYFYFIPYFIPAGYELFNYPPAQAEIIRDNLYNAASGVYKISFNVVEGTANVRLYSWNENRISFDGVYDTKADGTPADKYIDSVSGVCPSGTDERYTGENFVYLTIAPEHAVFNFQFGLISDAECKVTITVERIDDYVVDMTPDFVFEVDSEGNGKISNAVFVTLKTDRYINNNIVLLGIEAMSAGMYVLKITPPSKQLTVTAGSFYARLENGQEYCLWEGSTSTGTAQSKSYKNVITITDEDTFLYITNYEMSAIAWTITLEKYAPTTVTSGAWTYIPSTPVSFGETYQIPLNVAPGTYTISIRTFGTNHGGKEYPFTVNIGNKVFTISGKEAENIADVRFDYTGTVTVGAGDSIISLNCSTAMAVIARVELTAIA